MMKLLFLMFVGQMVKSHKFCWSFYSLSDDSIPKLKDASAPFMVVKLCYIQVFDICLMITLRQKNQDPDP